MTSLRRTPPTRHALLRVRRRLARVETAAELLTRKRRALVGELFRAARPVLDAREAVEWQSALAYTALLRAEGDRGAALLRALAQPLRELHVELEQREIWGLPGAEVLGHDPVSRPPTDRSFTPAEAGPAATAAAAEFERLLELLLDATTREIRIRRLALALAETSRRVNLLERRVAPALASESSRIAATLEEREREEQLRYRRLLAHGRERGGRGGASPAETGRSSAGDAARDRRSSGV